MKVLLLKRDDPLPPEVETYLKREFSQAERDKAAASGAALPDGSFPIHNKSDLSNAIRAVGRSKNPAKAKAHIKSRAETLGATDMLPDSWSKRDDDNVIDMRGLIKTVSGGTIGPYETIVLKDAIDFDGAKDIQEAGESASGLAEELNECICALNCAMNSIMSDETVTDKAAAISDSFDQFKAYIKDLKPESMEKIMQTPTAEQITKQITDAVAAAVKDSTEKIAKLEAEAVILKMSDKHKAFHGKLEGAAKDKFSAMTAEERDAEMEKTKKSLDPEIAKRLADAEQDRIVLKALVEKDEKATFAKRAVEIGLPEDQGEMLRKAHKGDAEALKAVEELIKTSNAAKIAAQTAGKIFKEFGTVQGGTNGASAYDQLSAKAKELRKSEKDLSPDQAFAKVYADPENAELVAMEKRERNSKMGVAA